MARNDQALCLTPKEIAASFADPLWGARFPPVLDIDQAAELLHTPKATIYDWSSRGYLKGCCRPVGKRLLFWRDRLLHLIFNEGLNGHV
jgi:hypothetical protein